MGQPRACIRVIGVIATEQSEHVVTAEALDAACVVATIPSTPANAVGGAVVG